MPTFPDSALSLAYLAAAGRALRHLRRVWAGLDQFSVYLGFKHWLLPHVDDLEQHTGLLESETLVSEDSFAAPAFSLPLLFL
jgi:hypothetical protein